MLLFNFSDVDFQGSVFSFLFFSFPFLGIPYTFALLGGLQRGDEERGMGTEIVADAGGRYS